MPGTTGSQAMSGRVGMTHNFAIQIDHGTYNLGTWAQASGLSVTWETYNYRTGDEGNDYWTLPGLPKYEQIVLKRAACADSRTVQQWLIETSRHPGLLSGAIQLVDPQGRPVIQWRLSKFFPVAWSILDFDAASGKPAIETLKFQHNGFLEDGTRK